MNRCKVETVVCVFCGSPFGTSTKNAKFCSKSHSRKAAISDGAVSNQHTKRRDLANFKPVLGGAK